MKKTNLKRTLRLWKMDGTHIDMEISKAASIDTKQSMICIDRLPDDTWRLIWDSNLIENFSDFKCIEMIREN